MSALRVTTRGVSFLRTAILARILNPAQFGAYGVATLVLALLEVLSETGVNIILVQQKETIDRYINSAWVVSIIRGFFIGMVIFLTAPFVAEFFRTEQALSILQLISIVPIIKGFINPSIVRFQKELVFHKEFYFRFSIFVFDATTAVIATYVLQSPLGIVYGLIAGAICEVVLSFMVITPIPRLQWDSSYIGTIFHRGKWVTASSVFNYLFYNLDNIVVGRMLGSSSLGLYQMAYTFSFLPISEVTDVFSRVTFPVYTKIVDDKPRLRRAFLRTTLVISLLTIPVSLILFLFPREIITIVLGAKWLEAAPILQVLAVFGVLRAISGSSSSVFLAAGKQNYVAIITFTNIAGLALTIVPLINLYGMMGAAIAVLIGTLVSLPVIAVMLKRLLL